MKATLERLEKEYLKLELNRLTKSQKIRVESIHKGSVKKEKMRKLNKDRMMVQLKISYLHYLLDSNKHPRKTRATGYVNFNEFNNKEFRRYYGRVSYELANIIIRHNRNKR